MAEAGLRKDLSIIYNRKMGRKEEKLEELSR
jgi:hypothetical protein